MSATSLSIIIPTCNRPAELSVCLGKLQEMVTQHTGVEVLVMDDGTASSQPMVAERFPWAHWQEGPRRGPAANRNKGALLATGGWLVFLDDDCVPSPQFLDAYVEAIRSKGGHACALVGATFSPQVRPSLLWEAPHNPKGEAVISCNFALPRKSFHDLGGFDERYPMAAFEDTEFEARVRSSGLSVHFVPRAVVDHPLRRIPSPRKLACRWEARVISTLDLGASRMDVLWRLPEHVLKVIVSRLRSQPWSWDTLHAAGSFFGEFLWVLWLLPGWIRRHAVGERSPFWIMQVNMGRAPARFGL